MYVRCMIMYSWQACKINVILQIRYRVRLFWIYAKSKNLPSCSICVRCLAMLLWLLLIHVCFVFFFIIFGKTVLLYLYANKSLESWIFCSKNITYFWRAYDKEQLVYLLIIIRNSYFPFKNTIFLPIYNIVIVINVLYINPVRVSVTTSVIFNW